MLHNCVPLYVLLMLRTITDIFLLFFGLFFLIVFLDLVWTGVVAFEKLSVMFWDYVYFIFERNKQNLYTDR